MVDGVSVQKAAVDPNVVIPPAVKKAAQRSEELAAQAKQAREARPPNADEPVRIANPPASTPNPATGVVTAPFDPSGATPPPDPTINQPPVAPAPDMEHQFNSMKGRYERADADNRRMAAQIADMQRLLASMPVGTPQTPRSQVPVSEGSGVQFTGPVTGQPQRQSQRRLSQKEIDEYTPELLDVVGRRSQEATEPAFNNMFNHFNNEIAQLRQQLGGVRGAIQHNSQRDMYSDLRTKVPNWEQINEMPEWHEWLRHPDPMTGIIRQNILASNYNNNQTGQIVATFERFMEDHNIKPSVPQLPPPANNGYAPPPVNLMALAAPGRQREGSPNVPQDRPRYSAKDIQQFFHDKTFGKYAGREQEAQTIEMDILRAPAEGRIIR